MPRWRHGVYGVLEAGFDSTAGLKRQMARLRPVKWIMQPVAAAWQGHRSCETDCNPRCFPNISPRNSLALLEEEQLHITYECVFQTCVWISHTLCTSSWFIWFFFNKKSFHSCRSATYEFIRTETEPKQIASYWDFLRKRFNFNFSYILCSIQLYLKTLILRDLL